MLVNDKTFLKVFFSNIDFHSYLRSYILCDVQKVEDDGFRLIKSCRNSWLKIIYLVEENHVLEMKIHET